MSSSQRADELVWQATDLYRKGQGKAALTLLKRARAESPYCTSGLLLEARIALDHGRTSECVLALESAAAAQPNAAHIQHVVGTGLLQQQRIRSGLLCLERSVQLAPHHSAYARSLAAAYASLGNLPAAEQVLNQAMAVSPHDKSLTVAFAQLSGPSVPQLQTAQNTKPRGNPAAPNAVAAGWKETRAKPVSTVAHASPPLVFLQPKPVSVEVPQTLEILVVPNGQLPAESASDLALQESEVVLSEAAAVLPSPAQVETGTDPHQADFLPPLELEDEQAARKLPAEQESNHIVTASASFALRVLPD